MVYRTTPTIEKRKQRKRERLLETAIGLFGRKGFHQTTVPMVVKAAKSSTGGFYFYFQNKEDVYAAALRLIGDNIAAALNTAIAAAGPDILEQMRAAVHALVEFLVAHPEQARILIIESSGLGKTLEGVRREIVASHTRSVDRALSAVAKQLPKMDTGVVASCWVGAVYEAVFNWLEQPAADRVPAARLAETIARFNLRGVGAPEETLKEGDV